MESLHQKGQILRFPRRSTCGSCGTNFHPLRPEHRLCRECYLWALAWMGIEQTRIALRAMREGGR